MADIELVIKIDEKLYETSKTLPDYMCGAYQRAIINGKPLSKNHGRLIDADALLKEHLLADYDCRITRAGIEFAPTIIEAEKE